MTREYKRKPGGALLQEAGLIDAEKTGRTILYRLKMSVLEEALLGFAHTLGWEMKPDQQNRTTSTAKRMRSIKGET